MLGLLFAMVGEEDKEKVRFLYDNYHKYVLTVSRSLLREAGDKNYVSNGEDVTQNVFLKLTAYIKSVNFNASGSELTAYVYTIVRNEVSTFLQKEKKPRTESVSESVDPDDDFIEKLYIKERMIDVENAIKRLDDELRTPIILKFVFEKTAKEISELTGVPERQVYYRIEKGKAAILAALGGGNDGD